MKPTQVLCTLRFTDTQLDKLRAVSSRLIVTQETARSSDDVTRSLNQDVEVLYAIHPPTTLEDAPGLKWLQLHTAGADHIIDTPVWNSDVIITSASGIHVTAIGEYVLAQMLALSRRLPRMIDCQRRAEWPSGRWNKFVGRELRGSTVGVIGYGSIGREVARLASSFGVRVLAVKRSPKKRADSGFTLPGAGDLDGTIPEAFYAPEQLRTVLAQSDYVVLAVPSTDKTVKMIGETELRAMPDHAYLINIARGDIIDQEALIRALREGWIGGAGLDVFDPEPLPEDSPLWDFENVIISPHVSGFTPRYDDYATDLFSENLRRYLAGEPLLNRVDRQRGY